MANIKTPIHYYGGKSSHLKWILPLLSNDCRTYVEPFCGSCAVLLNRPRARVEIANDIDGRLYNFWRVLRSKDGPELIRQLELTPRQELEFKLAKEDGPEDDPVEKARRYWLRSMWSMNGETNAKASYQLMIESPAPVLSMNTVRPRLEAVRQRIVRVQWTHCDGVKLCIRTDRPFTMIYADPPYECETRIGGIGSYSYESSAELHTRLLNWARNAQARVAISQYPSRTYDDLVGWWRVTKSVYKGSAGAWASEKSQKWATEALYLNYTPRNLKALGKSLDLGITRLDQNKD